MNIFHKVTLQTLKKNRTRTVVTIIGVILSAAMITAVTTFASSFRNYAIRSEEYSEGTWHARVQNSSYSVYEQVRSDERVDEAYFLQQLGYAKVQECQNEFKPYLYVLGAQESSFDFLPVHLTSGRLPANSGEILLPEHLYTNGGVKMHLGDRMILAMGNRVLQDDVLTQENPCYVNRDGEDVFNGETLEIREDRQYTVVGFYKRFPMILEEFSAPGYTALTVADAIPDETPCDVYFLLDHPEDITTFQDDTELYAQKHNDLLMYYGVFRFNTFHTTLYGLAAIVIGLIIFGSVALIYNAFSISVAQRTQQFGLLSSIGATKKQLRRMVRFEALTISAIGIPAGIAAGVGGIGVTLLFIGDKFQSFNNAEGVKLTLSVSLPSVIIAAAVALITVLISAWIPSKRATKISAVEAIRQNADVAPTKKPIKTSRLTYLLFGLPGMLAGKYYKRSKKKYRATVLSLFMSIVLFVSASAFTDYLTGAADTGLDTQEYELEWIPADYDMKTLQPDALLNQFNATDHVTGAAYLRQTNTFIQLSADALSDEGKAHPEIYRTKTEDGSIVSLNVELTFVDDGNFRSLLRQNHLSEASFTDAQHPLGLATNTVTRMNRNTERLETVSFFGPSAFSATITENIQEIDEYVLYDVHQTDNGLVYIYKKRGTEFEDGDFLELSEAEAVQKIPIQIGSVIRERPAFIPKSEYPVLIFPISAANTIFNGFSDILSDDLYRFTVQSDNHEACYTALRQILTENDLTPGNLYDIAAQEESDRNLITIVRVFSYGFIVLISLIAAANVFNTISTNIALRRREFAMLRSVGMTRKCLNRMMGYECLLYGFKSLLLGVPVACIITLLIYSAIDVSFETAFRLPWGAIGIAAVSVFAVVIISMLYGMHKVKKDNPIDALRNENL